MSEGQLVLWELNQKVGRQWLNPWLEGGLRERSDRWFGFVGDKFATLKNILNSTTSKGV